MTLDRNTLVKAAADVVAARLAIDAAAHRRTAAIASARNLIDLATATERAERDAAWSALRASVRILLSEQVAIGDIAELCGVPVDSVRRLSDRGPGDSPAAVVAPTRCGIPPREPLPRARRDCGRRSPRRRRSQHA